MDNFDERVNVQNLYFSSEHFFEPGSNNRALSLEPCILIMSLSPSSRPGNLFAERNCVEQNSLWLIKKPMEQEAKPGADNIVSSLSREPKS